MTFKKMIVEIDVPHNCTTGDLHEAVQDLLDFNDSAHKADLRTGTTKILVNAKVIEVHNSVEDS